MASQTELAREISAENGGSDFEWASQQEDRTKLWTARHKLYYAGLNMKPGNRAVTTDACVPVSNLPAMIEETRQDIDSVGITGKCQGERSEYAYLLLFPLIDSAHLWPRR